MGQSVIRIQLVIRVDKSDIRAACSLEPFDTGLRLAQVL